jgi:hypothetical protein
MECLKLNYQYSFDIGTFGCATLEKHGIGCRKIFAGFEREGRGNDGFALAFFFQAADEVPITPERHA